MKDLLIKNLPMHFIPLWPTPGCYDEKAGEVATMRCGQGNKVHRQNQKFGNLIVLRFSHRNSCGQSHWICKCICSKEKVVRGSHLLDGATKSCGCNNQGARNHSWKGYGEIGGWTWNNYRLGAKRRNIEFNITVKDMWETFLKQDRKCALTGAELSFSSIQCSNPNANASMDRIDSSKGYTIDNIQWVTKNINLMKRSLTQYEFIKICHVVSSHNSL